MYKMMLVDDEYPILDGLSRILDWDEYGIELTLCVSPAEAIQRMASERHHILLSDIRMPEMNGLSMVKALRDGGWDGNVILLSGYNDFEYVKAAIPLNIENYLVKPVNTIELRDTLEVTIEHINRRENMDTDRWREKKELQANIASLWLNGSLDEIDMLSKLSVASIDVLDKMFYTALFWVNTYDIGDASEKIRIRYTALKFLEELLAGDGFVYRIQKDEMAVLYKNENLMEFCAKAAARISKTIGAGIMAAAGESRLGPHQIPGAVGLLRDYSCLLPYIANKWTMLPSVEKVALRYGVPQINHINIIKRLCLDEDCDGLEKYLQYLLCGVRNSDGAWADDCGRIPAAVVLHIAHTILTHSFNARDHSRAERALFGRGDAAGASSALAGLLIKPKQADENNPSSFDAIMEYVHGHYMDNIGLAEIAGRFSISPAWLGQVFSSHIGDNFTSYFNRYRIKKARLLLEDGSRKISDISAMVGFTSVNYFNRVFKKLNGVTPQQYRKQM